MKTSNLILAALLAAPLSAFAAEAAKDVPKDAPKEEKPPAVPKAAPASEADAAEDSAGFSKNEIVHIIQKKPHPFGGKREASLLGAAQVNGKFTDHFGGGAQLTWHFQENFALLLDGVFYPYAQATTFSDELLSTSSLTAQAANQLLLRWATGFGVEMAPIYGKFAFYSTNYAQFAIYIHAGAGLGQTRLELLPPSKGGADSQQHDAIYGDTGIKFVGTVGVGVRVYMTDRLALRAEVRDQVLTARISTVNGCDADDLEALSALSSNPGGDVSVKGGCDKEAFKRDNYIAAGPGAQLIRKPSSDVVNNVVAFLGLSFLF
jgi:outer membrane beta-barrel protein